MTNEEPDGKIISQDKPKDFVIRAGVTLTIEVARNNGDGGVGECDDTLRELGQC